jgi:putative FmdB family regulatory protein
MPIYEYRCQDCGKKTTVLTLSALKPVEARCKHCGGSNMKKLVSRVAVLRSGESRLESLNDPLKMSGLDEDDPKSVARWMKKMGKEMGEEAGEDFNDSIDEAIEETEKGGGEGGEGGGAVDDDF